MTVMSGDEDAFLGRLGCSFCGDTIRGPYVFWQCHRNLNICAQCCVYVKDGLVSDIIVCAEIPESRERAGRFLRRMKNRRLRNKTPRGPA